MYHRRDIDEISTSYDVYTIDRAGGIELREPTILWKEAERLDLMVLRRLDVRVACHRDGKVFFIEELVEYNQGKRGWRRQQGFGSSGPPYTVRFDSADEADKAVVTERGEILASLAASAFGDPGAKALLRRLAVSGCFTSAEELTAAYSNMDSVIADAMGILGTDAPTNPVELRSLFVSGNLAAAELAAGWRQGIKRRQDHARSEALKVQKRQERQERRERDFDFLVEKAMESAQAAGTTAPSQDKIAVVGVESFPDLDRILDVLHSSLIARPYIRHIAQESDGLLRLWVSSDGLIWREWGPYEKWSRKRLIALRAQATDAFGENPLEHWGRVRARLLNRLKAPELDISHREAAIKRLAEARLQGVVFVVIGNIGFYWEEETGNWHRRDFDRPGTDVSTSRSRLWREGPIISNNHGRVIVLPFIKSDGTKVEGYTKNAPYQGAAEPRLSPIDIPFAIYDDLKRDETWEPSGDGFSSTLAWTSLS